MEKISLNGSWNFTKEQLTKDNFLEISWEKVTVPHTWNNIDGQNGGNNYHRGLCWYNKTIKIKKHDGKIFLEFEGINSVSTVLLNSTLLGIHKGGYSTFRYDITNIAHEGDNFLIVGADNSHNEEVYPLMADFTFYGGIYRNTSIIYTNNVCFDLGHFGSTGVYVSQTNITKEKAEFKVDTYLKNYSSDLEVTTKVILLDHDEKELLSQSKSFLLSKKAKISYELSLKDPHLWNGVKDPYLYTVNVELLVNNKVVDSRKITTGFRSFTVDDTFVYLNGQKIKLNGVSRHQDRWGVGNALTNKMHDEDMEFIKEVGANSIRLAHYQQAQYFYDLCDKEGMIVWAEIPYISISSKTDKKGTNALSQMEELIKQNYNHSSIVMWGVQNEITIQGKRNNLEEIVQNLHDLAKELDPYRFTTQAQVAFLPSNDPLNDVTDLIASNQYFGWYMGEAEDFIPYLEEYRKNTPNRPLGLSEYGAEGIIKYHTDNPVCKDYTEEYHALWHEKVYTILSNTDFVWGTYVWNMFSFAADARDEGGVKGLNNKGLVTIDRKIRKDAFYYYKAKWNKTPMVHLCSKRFVERHNKDIELKAYSNLGEVKFYLNGTLVDTVLSDDVVFITKVTLVDGENKVLVTSANENDETIFITVDEPNPEYSVPKADQGKGIFSFDDAGNWFDEITDEDKAIEINPDYFSIEDQIGDILDNKEGLELFQKYMQSFIDHPMFEMAKGFSIKMLTEFDKNAIPEGLVIILNKELQKIKK
ncbi:MAG: glycoside hydrolase family 2 protein [Candidatus Izimaplasma sp.]|nr:glycoside hydrolase family 2 protein [Candidatus Izimaplasma bacterium]